MCFCPSSLRKTPQDDQTLTLVVSLKQKTSYEHILREVNREVRRKTTTMVEVKDPAAGKGEPKKLFDDEDDGDDGENGELPLTPELRRAVAKLSAQYEQELNQVLLSVHQDMQTRKGLSDDNSWLWMQITQLKKQLEEAFDMGGKPKQAPGRQQEMQQPHQNSQQPRYPRQVGPDSRSPQKPNDDDSCVIS